MDDERTPVQEWAGALAIVSQWRDTLTTLMDRDDITIKEMLAVVEPMAAQAPKLVEKWREIKEPSY